MEQSCGSEYFSLDKYKIYLDANSIFIIFLERLD